jgi:general secretion pathway protein K
MWILHKKRRAAGRKQAGSALLTVLWLCAALSAIGLAVASNVRGETERASTNVDDTKSWFIARGAVERAALHILWGQDYYRFGTPAIDLAFPGAQVHVDVIPETSKMALNMVPEEQLLRLLTALGVPEGNATEITAAVADWRTPADLLKASPFDAFYLAQSPSFLPRHASFTENEELLLVKGITPELYYGTSLDGSRSGLRDCISVYGSSGAFDINTVRFETLEAIGMAPEDAAALVKSRDQHPVTDFNEMERIQKSLGQPGARLRIGGQVIYTLRATAQLRRPDGKLSDLRRTVAALVRINFPGNRKGKVPGFEVIRWYDRT